MFSFSATENHGGVNPEIADVIVQPADLLQNLDHDQEEANAFEAAAKKREKPENVHKDDGENLEIANVIHHALQIALRVPRVWQHFDRRCLDQLAVPLGM